MTIPWLLNCGHDDHGWCLECVKKLGEENADLLAACKQARSLLGGLGGSDELGDFYAAEVDRVEDLLLAAIANAEAPG